MKISKEKLINLEMVYSINIINISGKDYCIAASEAREGKAVLIDCETKNAWHIEGLSGGIMSMVPVCGEEGAFYAIQRFYPVFQSKDAEIIKATISPGEGKTIQAYVENVIPMPYVHRICAGGSSIIAATLCAEKQFEQDWSSPGEVYKVEAFGGRAEKHCVLGGIHKNHGMYEYKASVLISGEEGVFEIRRDGDSLTHTKWLSDNVSDMCMYDLDGDGQDELITIAPFHGDTLRVYRKSGDVWTPAAEEKLSFGHAVWAGKIDDIPCIIACSRGGEKETKLYQASVSVNGTLELRGELIDGGVGAANIVVRQECGKTVFYAANHGINEVARYTITS